ncbi:lactate racemase domain-containing protein [Chloroflexota bacterium]
MTTIKLPQYLWFEPKDVDFPLPDSWEVTVHNIAGYNRPAMKAEEIRAAVTSPIGMPPLRELAKDRKEVVIIFDDMTRSTRVYEIIPFVLEELAAAGVTDDRIRFIAAVANHQAMDRISMVKKLGEDIVSRFPVYNHCPFMNCTDIGTSSYGTRAEINSEVMYCDLKIGIGQIVPHPQYGLSGGGKIIIPGVASYDTVVAHHGQTHEAWKQDRVKRGLRPAGVIDNSPINADAQEIARMAGLDMLINCIVNMWGETVDIFTGALEPSYKEAVKEAKTHYKTTNTGDSDIVIANSFIKAAESGMAMANSLQALSPQGGDFVLIGNSPAGQDIHYLFNAFGKTISGSLSRSMMIPPHIHNLIIYNEFPEARSLERFVNREKVLPTSDWKQVIQTLEKSHGDGTKVAVYPSADIQYFDD